MRPMATPASFARCTQRTGIAVCDGCAKFDDGLGAWEAAFASQATRKDGTTSAAIATLQEPSTRLSEAVGDEPAFCAAFREITWREGRRTSCDPVLPPFAYAPLMGITNELTCRSVTATPGTVAGALAPRRRLCAWAATRSLPCGRRRASASKTGKGRT